MPNEASSTIDLGTSTTRPAAPAGAASSERAVLLRDADSEANVLQTATLPSASGGEPTAQGLPNKDVPGEDLPHEDTSTSAVLTPGAGERKGLVMIFTGAGKGKTTAALGSGFRAAGNGMRVLMLQFIKGSWHYGELDAAATLGDTFQIRPMGRGFIKVGGAETDPEDLRLINACWAEAERAIGSGEWDMVILDEILYAIGYGLLDADAVARTLNARPPLLHVLLTGRNAHPALIAIADTVTEMQERKHAYTKGIQAQKGIEY